MSTTTPASTATATTSHSTWLAFSAVCCFCSAKAFSVSSVLYLTENSLMLFSMSLCFTESSRLKALFMSVSASALRSIFSRQRALMRSIFSSGMAWFCAPEAMMLSIRASCSL